MKALLQINNLTWKIDHQAVLDNINLSVAPGEFIGIIGPNGAGKTSLLRSILGLIDDADGQIHYHHKPIDSYSQRQLAQHIAVVGQQHSPIFSLALYDVVRMGLLPHKTLFATDTDADRQNIAAALSKVGLESLINKPFDHLSGGEQQRAMIARALVQGAQLLLMDEPTNHLDIHYQHQIMHLVKALKITLIMTVHDLNLAAAHCQRLILLDNGRVVADGSPDQVLQPELLGRVFNIHCHRDNDPVTGAPRVSFSLAKQRA